MLQYLIILLDDTAVSYCHYPVVKTERRLIGLDTLRRGILFAMKENLNIQFVYPDYELPEEYREVIETIDHTKIKGREAAGLTKGERNDAGVVVVDGIGGLSGCDFAEGVAYVVRTPKTELFAGYETIGDALGRVARLNVVITDIETFTDDDFDRYKAVLERLSVVTEQLYIDGKSPQINILTDRMMLTEMNNCGAGETNITLAPDGRFYVCPAFYQSSSEFSDKAQCVGNLQDGLEIKNKQLYRIDHAPLCRICDAYQCKRCVWLNRRTTLEVNTPSHEQCVVAHLERNASRRLLNGIRKHGTFLPKHEEIKEITYLDPFEIRGQW